MRNSNICREVRFTRRRLPFIVLAALAAACFAHSVLAIDPNRIIAQYIRDYWGSDKGFTGGSVSAFAQTADGYLWIATNKGLFRFDGLRFQAFPQATPTSFPIGAVQGLTTDVQGNLWILLQNTKILRYHDGKFELGNEEAEFGITSVGNRRDGTTLFSSLALGTLTYRDGKFKALSPALELASSSSSANSENRDILSSRLSWATGVTPHRFAEPNSPVTAIAETTDGTVWLGTNNKGLFYLNKGRVVAAANGPSNIKINCLLALDNRELLIGTEQGILRWNGTALTSQGVPGTLRHAQILSIVRDRDSNIWVGTPGGVTRISPDGVSVEHANPKIDSAVTALFEDREGNLWLGSSSGIERLRDSAFVTYSLAGEQNTGPIYGDATQRLWFGPLDGGLRWLKGQNNGAVTVDGLARDVVYTITGTDSDVWIGRQHGGLTHVVSRGGQLIATTYTERDGLPQNSVYATYESSDGTVWAGTLSAGVGELRNGHFKTYTTADGLVSNTIAAITESDDGTMWFATPSGISALSNGHWQSFRAADGLPSANVNCLQPDASGTLWIGTASGLAFLRDGRIHIPSGEPPSLHAQVLGLAVDKLGWLWISTSNHVLRVKRDSLLHDAIGDTDVHTYGIEDGLLGTEGVKRNESVVADSLGRVWFSMNHGLSVVDPARAMTNSAPALVHIDGLSADGNPVEIKKTVRFAPARRRITFDYAALSLSVPERVRYKYKLDGLDDNWSDPVSEREVTYNNLSSGSYRFRVTASNSDGLWNSSESVIPFEIERAYWQTWWFRIAGALVAVFAMLLFFRLRLLRIKKQMNMRFEERLAERTRIAQELHDTLLQGFLSASMQLHVADDQLAPESPAKPFVGRVLELMARVIDEGRNAVRGLRLPDARSENLEQAFSALPQELELARGSTFRVFAEGEARALRPIIRESVYRIGREAVINAFRHSRASKIEVELQYLPKYLRLLIRDNGVGIDQEVVRSGLDGHWGLSGMRERAEEINAKLRVLSSHSAGTEIELSVPSRIAFESRYTNNRWRWLSKLRSPTLSETDQKTESRKLP
ncbi:MAG TPA: two-component regulator propeller domain-containing protein [Candidatus Acidoferrales bacterium]|nr:two-component regulator propeller domain-containing protein [Candidatus Acidoferrales bacterium]